MKNEIFLYICSYFLLNIIITSGFGCTKNPFFKDNEITNRSLKGRVTLSDSSIPDNIYVWLNGFNMGTRTNSNGDYELTYPPSSEQGSGSGISEELTLYFYVADYALDSLKILFINGEIASGQGHINEDGQIPAEVVLKKLVYFDIEVDPLTVTMNATQTFFVTITMQTDSNNAWINMMSIVTNKHYYQTGIFIVHEESGSMMSKVDQPGYTPTDYLIGDTLIIWNIGFYHNISNFPAGNYQMVPYIIVKQPGIPADLLNSISPDLLAFGPDYLKLPFKRMGGKFIIIGGR